MQYSFLCGRISMVFLLLYLLLFLRLRFSWRRSIALAAAVFLLTTPMDAVQSFCLEDSWLTLAVTLAQAAIVQGTALCFSRYSNWSGLFVGLSAAVYVLAGNLTGMFFYTETGRLFAAMLVQILLNALVFFVLYRLCRAELLAAQAGREAVPWLALCLVPALLYSIEYSLAVWPQSIYDEPENALTMLLVLALALAAYAMVFRLFGQIRRSHDTQRSLDHLTASVEHLKQQIESTRRNQLELSVLKHDMRHDNNVLLAYLDEGRIDRLRAQLEQMNARVDRIVTARYCGNTAVNSVLQSNAAQAARSGVEFRCEAQLPAKLPLDEFELAIVLSNLAENAVQAAAQVTEREKRWVQVRVYPVKSQLLLSVVNPYAGEVSFDEETGLPRSAKGEGHGYGLQSVRFFADRVGAIFDCAAENGVFSVRLLLPWTTEK